MVETELFSAAVAGSAAGVRIYLPWVAAPVRFPCQSEGLDHGGTERKLKFDR